MTKCSGVASSSNLYMAEGSEREGSAVIAWCECAHGKRRRQQPVTKPYGGSMWRSTGVRRPRGDEG